MLNMIERMEVFIRFFAFFKKNGIVLISFQKSFFRQKKDFLVFERDFDVDRKKNISVENYFSVSLILIEMHENLDAT
jgi:hypothetical protein